MKRRVSRRRNRKRAFKRKRVGRRRNHYTGAIKIKDYQEVDLVILNHVIGGNPVCSADVTVNLTNNITTPNNLNTNFQNGKSWIDFSPRYQLFRIRGVKITVLPFAEMAITNNPIPPGQVAIGFSEIIMCTSLDNNLDSLVAGGTLQ